MDLSALDLGQTSHTARDRNAGRDILETDDGLFADALLEMAELRDADAYRDPEDHPDDSDTAPGKSETDTAAAATDTDTERGDAEQATASPLILSTVKTATTSMSGEATAATLQTQTTAGATAFAGQISMSTSNTDTSTSTWSTDTSKPISAAGTAKSPVAGHHADTILSAGQMTAQVTTAAALQGEARVLAKRSDTITANNKHVQNIKAELTGKASAGEAGTGAGANGQAAKGDNAVATSQIGREATSPASEIARLEQALRQAFPAAAAESAGAASTNTATNPMPRPGAETLLAQRGADQNVEQGSHLTGTGERATPAATAKAAASRPAFNLPAGRPAEQVSVQIQNGLRNGSDRIQIKLTPASLGTVEVKLELAPDKTVQAIVSADKPETLEMLERDARVLQKALEEAGLRTNSDSLSFSQRDSGDSADAQSDGDTRTASGEAGEHDSDTPSDNTDSLIETQARRSHDGLIDIEA